MLLFTPQLGADSFMLGNRFIHREYNVEHPEYLKITKTCFYGQ